MKTTSTHIPVRTMHCLTKEMRQHHLFKTNRWYLKFTFCWKASKWLQGPVCAQWSHCELDWMKQPHQFLPGNSLISLVKLNMIGCPNISQCAKGYWADIGPRSCAQTNRGPMAFADSFSFQSHFLHNKNSAPSACSCLYRLQYQWLHAPYKGLNFMCIFASCKEMTNKRQNALDHLTAICCRECFCNPC